MARPLTATQFLAALKAEGVLLCTDCADSGWATHRRGPFGAEVHGIVVHHTASNDTPTGLIRRGRPDLNGPLAIGHITRDGVLHLVGFGRCNHAGKCDGDVLEAMKRGLPAPTPNQDTADFNAVTYGFELNGTNDGQEFTAEQVDTITRACAALCRAHAWNAHHVVGHREATRRKPGDPSGIGMGALRSRVTVRLEPQATSPTRPRPPIVKPALPPTLRIGSRDRATVKLLQAKLRRHGHKVVIDGLFGTGTRAAVLRHQKAWRLVADGVVGPATWRTLLTR